MRIARLDLTRYGCFTDHSLDFADGRVDLHIICGPNEAGKSTAKSAIEDLFFGFGRTSNYAFLHDQNVLRVGALIEGGDAALEFRRKKGTKDTLLGPDEKPLAGDRLRVLLGGADRQSFERMWSLDHLRLREGGRQILDAKDDVGRMLFEAGVGLVGLREHLGRLDKDADAIYAPRASSQRSFYIAQTRLKDAEKRLREATVTTRDWLKARTALDELVSKRDALLTQLREKKARRVRMERIRRVLPVIAELHRIESELCVLGDPPTLPPDAATVLQAAEREQLVADQQLRQLDEQDRAFASELEELVIEEAMLSKGSEIDALTGERGAAAQSRDHVARRRTELSEKEKRLATLLAEIERPPLPLDEVEALLPARPTVERLRDLLEARSGLDAAFAAAADEKARSEDDQLELRLQMEAQPVPADPALLAGAAQAARNRPDLTSDIRRLVCELETLDVQLTSALTLLRPFDGPVGSLQTLPIPVGSRIEDARLHFLEIANRIREVDAELDDIHGRLGEARVSKQKLLQTGAAVSLEEVTLARDARDRTWLLLRRRHIEGLAVEDREVKQVAGNADLPGAFESMMRSADEVSDRRFTGAQDSARLVDLDVWISLQNDRITELTEERKKLDASNASALQEWISLWSDCGFSPDTPEDMAEWTKKRMSALALLDARTNNERQLALLRAEEASLSGQILAALSLLDPKVHRPESAPLPQLLAEADDRLRRFDAAAVERNSLSKEVHRATTRVAAAERKLGEARKALTEWESAWADALEKAGRPPDEPREATRGALSVYDEIRELAGQARDLTDRIRKMTEDAATFDLAARRLSILLGTGSDQLSTDAIAEELAAGLRTNRERKAKRETLSGAREKLRGERSKAEEQRRRAFSQVAQLLRAAKCDSVDALRAAIVTAQSHKECSNRLERELHRLAEAGNGEQREVLERECDGADRDRMPAELEELESDIESDTERVRVLDLEVAEARRVFEQIAGDDVAGAAAADRQLALSEMQDEAQRYVKLRTASILLRWAIERYRQTRHGPLLERAGGLFRRLTCDRFSSLCVDLDEKDKPLLLGVRGDGSQVPVDRMSDGCIDQLYLALRLAAIDEHLAAAAALPLVADDLFINFDDTRAAAGIRVLADLAQRCQVLFFTHHAHLVKVAIDAIGREALSLHEL